MDMAGISRDDQLSPEMEFSEQLALILDGLINEVAESLGVAGMEMSPGDLMAAFNRASAELNEFFEDSGAEHIEDCEECRDRFGVVVLSAAATLGVLSSRLGISRG